MDTIKNSAKESTFCLPLPLTQEYFCNNCGQFKGSFIKNIKCFNCSSLDIIIGEVNSLDKEALKNKFNKEKI